MQANLNSNPTTQPFRPDSAPGGRFRAWPQDGAAFSTHRICPLRHNFNEHPLMQMPELAKLAKRLYPKQQCRFIKPGATQASSFDHAGESHDGRTIDEVFGRIEEPRSWVALYNVETDSEYKHLLDEVLGSVAPLVTPEQPGIFSVGGFIFISAPPSVTPFHIDRENNFWLQVKGRKTMHVWDANEPSIVADELVEEFILTGALNDVKLREDLRARSHRFDVGPGDGVYFPSTSPHMTATEGQWAVPGDGVSVSIGVVFYTSTTRRTAYIHAFNRLARKLGSSPKAPGRSPLIDRAKYPLGRVAHWALTRYRGYERKAGF